jgi:acyl dehydratase
MTTTLAKDLVGKTYPPTTYTLSADVVAAYRAAVGAPASATNAHPVHALVAATPSERLPLRDAALVGDVDGFLKRMVRAGNTLRWKRALRVGDVVEATAKVTGVEAKSTGELLAVAITLKVAGADVASVDCTYFVRAPPKDGEPGAPKAAAAAPPKSAEAPAGLVLGTSTRAIDASTPRTYAEPSDDKNPIHLDADVAKAAGFADVILQGSCTLAYAASAVVAAACDHDDARIRSLTARYAKPVLPGDALTFTVRDAPGGVLVVDAVNQAGAAVLAGVRAEVQR